MVQPTPSPIASAGAGDQAVADSIVDAMVAIGRSVRRNTRTGMDQGQFFLLTVLSQQDETRLTDLATAVELDSSTVSRHIRQLEQGRLVCRRPAPEDRRAQLLSLTPEGAEALARARAQRRSMIIQRLQSWSDADVVALEALLTRLAQEVSHG